MLRAVVDDPNTRGMIDIYADDRYFATVFSKFKIHRYSKHHLGSRFMLELLSVTGFIHVDAIERSKPK